MGEQEREREKIKAEEIQGKNNQGVVFPYISPEIGIHKKKQEQKENANLNITPFNTSKKFCEGPLLRHQ